MTRMMDSVNSKEVILKVVVLLFLRRQMRWQAESEMERFISYYIGLIG